MLPNNSSSIPGARWSLSEGHQRAVAASQHVDREPGADPVCLLHQREHQLQRRLRDEYGRDRNGRQDG